VWQSVQGREESEKRLHCNFCLEKIKKHAEGAICCAHCHPISLAFDIPLAIVACWFGRRSTLRSLHPVLAVYPAHWRARQGMPDPHESLKKRKSKFRCA
jgi:hypothetical protein